MMMTLYIQELPDDWIRPAAWPVQRGGIVTSPRFAFGFSPAAKLEARFRCRCVDPHLHLQLYCGTGRALPGGKGEHGSALSHRELHATAGGYAGYSAAGHFCDCGGPREAARRRDRLERRAVEYALPRGWLDRAAGSASRSGQPHECVCAIPAGVDRAGTHDQTVRRGAMGGVGRCQVGAGRCFSRAVGLLARSLGAATALVEGRGFRAYVPASRPWRAHGGLAAFPICLARSASHRARHGIAQENGLVAARWRALWALVYDGR